MILTPEQACKSILEMLNRWADTVPEERRDAVMKKMLNVFQGPETKEKPDAA